MFIEFCSKVVMNALNTRFLLIHKYSDGVVGDHNVIMRKLEIQEENSKIRRVMKRIKKWFQSRYRKKQFRATGYQLLEKIERKIIQANFLYGHVITIFHELTKFTNRHLFQTKRSLTMLAVSIQHKVKTSSPFFFHSI